MADNFIVRQNAMIDTTNESLKDFYEALYAHHIILLYKGGFNQELIRSVLALTESKHGLKNESSLVKSRVTSIIVECMQNICRHAESHYISEGKEEVKIKMKPGIFLVGKNDEEYFIATGNLVQTSHVAKLKTYLDKVNGMNIDDLRKFHKQILRNTDLYGKYGADLGLINIAKISSKSFEYDFRQFDETCSFYSFSTSVSTQGVTIS